MQIMVDKMQEEEEKKEELSRLVEPVDLTAAVVVT